MSIPETIPVKNLLPGDCLGALVQSDRVHTSLYTSSDIFALEIEKIFNRTWVWVAHESEVPDAGSFKSAMVGTQPVIVVRDRKGGINVLLNRCRHRAATVCEHRSGKTNGFTCPYHGWGYGLDGALRGVPHPESYGDTLEKDQLGMVRLRTESYAGMIFASFNPQIEPLTDFLGPTMKWMDLFMK
jgi:phenylpropionate dioxygenase-like ring-hydroxylating dioxygenase large terminal subunit